jgi:hypothetical protein
MATSFVNEAMPVGLNKKIYIVDPQGLTDVTKRIELSISLADFAEKPKVQPTVSETASVDHLDVIRSAPDESTEEPYLIIGFDTEFKSPPAFTLQQIREGGLRYRVLSYQFHAATSNGLEWSGICLPEDDQRLTVPEFMLFALAMGARQYGVTNLPTTIYLVGHFTRADVPAFTDFQTFSRNLDAVRGTFVSTSHPVNIVIDSGEKRSIDLNIHLRDSMLLTPQSSKSLKALGELVGVPKVDLHEDKSIRQDMISNMDRVRAENWELFRRYALTDAVICVAYFQKVIRLYYQITGKFKVPLTLSSIGTDILIDHWQKKGQDALAAVGKELVQQKRWDKKANKYRFTRKPVVKEILHIHENLISECYHGGRNEQFWFGPAFDDTWIDYDLAGAYPTSMAAIGTPLWDEIHQCDDIDLWRSFELTHPCSQELTH